MSPTPSLSSWASASLAARLAWVGAFRREVATARDQLCRLMDEELGKPAHEALMADIAPLLASCRWHERRAARVLRERAVPGRPLFMLGVGLREARAPLGRLAVIATWNYPVQLLGIQLVQALVAGNTVVVKPSENAPRTQALLLELALEAGLPEGVLTWTDATREAGAHLLDGSHGAFDHVVFTGSTGVGRQIAAWAGPNLVPTTLELSGRDSAFVVADADVALAARSIWQGVTFNAGQTCVAPRRALVDRAVYREFIAALAPLAAGARARRLVNAEAAARVHRLCRAAHDAGARSLSGVLEAPRIGSRGAADEIVPLAMAECPEDSELLAGEHFGPALAVTPVSGLEHALAIHGRIGQHLSASVFSRNRRAAGAMAPRLGATAVMINDCVLPTALPGASIGGVGPSGWGLSRGEHGLLAMTRPVQISSTSSWLRPPISPPTAAVLRTMSSLVGRLYGARRGAMQPAHASRQARAALEEIKPCRSQAATPHPARP